MSKVLVITTDPSAKIILRELLTSMSHTSVFDIADKDILAYVRKDTPDIIIIDTTLSDTGGYILCERLRATATCKGTPILLMIDETNVGARNQTLNVLANDFIQKPLNFSEVMLRINACDNVNILQRMHATHRKSETAINHSPDAIVLADVSGNITLSNHSFSKIYARSTTNISDALPAAISQQIQASLKAKQPVIGPLTFEHNSRYYELRVHVVSSDESLCEYIIRDITDRKLLERQLMCSQRIEILGQLAGGIVHDVNNIFGIINGYTSLLNKLTTADATNKERYIKQINVALNRGSNLLKQILTFSKGGASTMQPLSLNKVVIETGRVLGDVIGNSIKLVISPDDALPNILGNENQMQQVIMNLCLNARDASSSGSTITVSTHHMLLKAGQLQAQGFDLPGGAYVCLRVSDTGSGIEPEHLAKLFEPFFTTKPPNKGTGLGLATVMRIINLHQGYITVESTLAVGTTFTCYIPRILS